MIQLENSIVIDRPIKDVFDVVGNPLRDPEWHFDVVEAAPSEESRHGTRVCLGAKYRWSFDYLGQGRRDATAEVKTYEAGQKLDLVVVSADLVQGIGYRLQPLGSSSTLMTRIGVLCHPSASSSSEAVLRTVAKNRALQYLAQLRQLLEGGPLDPFLGRRPPLERRPLHLQ